MMESRISKLKAFELPRKAKETAFDLSKYVNKSVEVKFDGGRKGILKHHDVVLNLVLDEAVEFLRDLDDPLKTTNETRRLGLMICRGTSVIVVAPADGTEEIPSPSVHRAFLFVQNSNSKHPPQEQSSYYYHHKLSDSDLTAASPPSQATSPQSEDAKKATTGGISFSIWPPPQCMRDALITHIIEIETSNADLAPNMSVKEEDADTVETKN